MNKVFVFVLAFLVSATVAGQDFKILFLNTETIKIGKRDLSIGDVFGQTETIFWSDSKQAMEVLSLSDNKQYLLVSSDFKQKHLKSAKAYLIKSNRMSTRGTVSLSRVARSIGNKVYAIDTARVAINFTPAKEEYFFIESDGKRYELDLWEGNLLFPPEIWSQKHIVDVDLFYHHSYGEEECIKEGLHIIPLPKEIKSKKRSAERIK
jgi:hypothetical protein